MPPKKAGAQNSNKPYSKPEHIGIGEVLTDLSGKQWKIGKSIGSGGFGEIYLASDDVTKPVNDKANYVVKIEPFSNGPLFVEIAFYIRAAKPEMINEWKQQHKMESLGMPCYIGSGAHDYNSQKYRFMIIPRFGLDLYKLLVDKPGKRLSHKAVFAIALQVLDIYEYIHSKEFVHADVKASNLALELQTNSKKKHQQLYLLDYGLALKYVDANGRHCPYGPDARKAHNGTLEYASRDAHIGAFSRRGDLEVLGYNMMEWLCGKLPWGREEPPEKVHRQKQLFMVDPSLKKIYPTDIPGLDIIEKFLRYVEQLEFEEKPNYTTCREMFKKGLPALKGSLFLDELGAGAAPSKSKAATKRRSLPAGGDPIAKKMCVPQVEEEEPNPKRSTRTTKKVKDFNWARVLSTDPEKIVRAATSLSQQVGSSKDEMNGHKPPSPIIANPTPAMLQILSKKKENIRSPIKSKVVQLEGTSTLTPAMKEILMRKKKATASVLKSKAKPKPKPVSVTGAPTESPSTRSRRTKQ